MPRKPLSIVDRDPEWKELSALYESGRPELAVVLGRRRAGKSFVLSKFATAVKGLYYQASSRTENEQLLNLSQTIGKTFGDVTLERGVAFPAWESLLDDLTERATGKPLLVVLDEFPYLASAAPGFQSLIQRYWDHHWSDKPIKLVLSGSHITAMQRMEAGDQPLYGRRTARIPFFPFSYRQIAAFLPHYSAEDQLRAFGIFGGLPGNLSLLNPDVDLGSNVAKLLLRPNGRLYDDAQHLLDAFLSSAEVHYSIIEAIARGDRTWGRITSRVGRGGGSLLRPTQWLQEMEIIRRVVPLTETNPVTSKRAVYRISDPYLTFWHRHVAPLVSSGGVTTTDGDLLWRRVIAPKLDDYMGEIFEDICREFVRGGGIARFKPIQTGQWWDSTSANEIDIVATDEAGQVFVAECKWGQIDSRDLKALRERAELMAQELKGVSSIKYALFSRLAPTDRALLQDIESKQVSWFGLPALFQKKKGR